MSLRTTGIVAGFGSVDFTRLKGQMTDYQRQLGTGMKSETYGGLGSERSLALGFQSSRSDIAAWQGNISLVTTRIKIMDTALTNTQKTVASVKTALASADFTLAGGRTTGQLTASGGLDSIISMLNSSDGSRYMFSGRASATEPVLDSGSIMAGAAGKDGFQTVMRERMQADLGSAASSPERDSAATGRLTLSALGTQPVTLDEDGAHSFGAKIASVSGSVGGITAALTAGPPASLTLTAGAGTTSVGESQTIGFTMPDGSTERIVLSAVAANEPTVPAGSFKIGATTAETLDNMRGALGASLQTLVSTKLAAASAVKAGQDFFQGETNPATLGAVPTGAPKRLVAGASGTMQDAVAYDTAANGDAKTLRWYRGDTGSGSARATSAAQVDSSVNVSYGARADEEALRSVVQNLTVVTAMTFGSSDTVSQQRYQALATRVSGALAGEGASQTVTSIQVELAAANVTATSAGTRHKGADAMYVNMLSDVTGVNNEEVGAYILALQTQLQASYQTTSMLSKLSLVSFL